MSIFENILQGSWLTQMNQLATANKIWQEPKNYKDFQVVYYEVTS